MWSDAHGRGQPVAPGQISAHLLVERVVVEQAVELDEDRIGLASQLGHAGKYILGRIAIDEHIGASLASVAGFALDHLPQTPIRRNPAHTASKLHR